MNEILYIHQGTELYGSDKSIIDIIKAASNNYDVVHLVVPSNGALVDKLANVKNLSIVYSPVCKIERGTFSIKGVLKLIQDAYQIYKKTSHFNWDDITLIHNNTLACFGGVFLGAVKRKKILWNVREIIERPKLVRVTLSLMLRLSSTSIVYNSNETFSFWRQSIFLRNSQKQFVIDNGVTFSQPESDSLKLIENRRTLSKSKLNITCSGRINDWKGQDVLLNAALILKNKGITNFKIILIGDCYQGYEHIKDELVNFVDVNKLSEIVHFYGFIEDVNSVYKDTDIIVIPSKKPEPFGRVAVEGMAFGAVPVCSNSGGLLSIIDNMENGLHFEMGNSSELADKLALLLVNGDLRNKYALKAIKKAYGKYNSNISIEKYINLYSKLERNHV